MTRLSPFLPLLLAPLAAQAQTEPPPAIEAPRAAAAPILDGLLDEPVWKTAPAIDLQAGTARLCWTPEGLYAAFESQDPALFASTSAPGSSLHEGDVFEIFFDAIGDHLQYTEVQVNAADRSFFKNYILTAPPLLTKTNRLTKEFCDSQLWRYDLPAPEGFTVKSRVVDGAWTTELFLPAKFLNRRRGGTPLEAGITLYLNLARYDWNAPMGGAERKAEFHYWVSVEPGCPHISPTRMGAVTLTEGRAEGPTAGRT
jgi:hypothetical protein